MMFPHLADDWAASIAHEVNQPLAAIVTNAESCLAWLARDQPDVDRARQAAERIVRTGYHASDVVRSLRALGRGSPPHLEPLDVEALIADVFQLMSAEISTHSIIVEKKLVPNVPRLFGDRTQLQQVLVNLIRNGIESMLASDGAYARILRVSTSREPHDVLRIAVTDSGAGLDECTRSRLFEPFFTTKCQGTGLGLAICRSIVENHGGRLWATPCFPRGCTFQFTLPVSEPAPTQ